jgi:hypothetical protein
MVLGLTMKQLKVRYFLAVLRVKCLYWISKVKKLLVIGELLVRLWKKISPIKV